MKKPFLRILIPIACLLAGIALGFFVGRNMSRTPVQIHTLPAASQATQPTQPPASGSVNINTADVAELQTLPGIGPVLAQRIVDYRQSRGGFETVGELANVSGIGTGKLEEIWDYVTTGG